MLEGNSTAATFWGRTPDRSLGSEHQVYAIGDDVQISRSLHFLLATAGFVSRSFASASDFLDSLPGLKPAPILIDVRMPTIGDIELISLLHNQGIRWPMIVMSAQDEIPATVQSIKCGATEFLEKPFDFDALELSLHAAVEQLSSPKKLGRDADEIATCFLTP